MAIGGTIILKEYSNIKFILIDLHYVVWKQDISWYHVKKVPSETSTEVMSDWIVWHSIDYTQPETVGCWNPGYG